MKGRRSFLKSAVAAAGATAMGCAAGPAIVRSTKGSGGLDDLRAMLAKAAYTPEQLERYFDPAAHNWARFDPDLGYLNDNCHLADGLDGARTISRYGGKNGERRMVNFADMPCRIATYGDSFTQGHQVSDGETWQEHLAAHFGEPILNYGTGGHGVYQAYRRLKRIEPTADGVPYLLLNMYGDDHRRNVTPWRWLVYGGWWQTTEEPLKVMFHGNPWAHCRIAADGSVEEVENPFPAPESLSALCDPGFAFDYYKDDPIVRAMCATRREYDPDVTPIIELAEILGLELDWTTAESRQSSAARVWDEAGWRSTAYILDELKAFAASHDKRVFMLLTYPDRSVVRACQGIDRDGPDNYECHPRWLREGIVERGYPLVDALPKHVADFAEYKLTPEDYVARHYIGHYTPRGNQFFAYAIKDELRAWLDPAPPAYRGGDPALSPYV